MLRLSNTFISHDTLIRSGLLVLISQSVCGLITISTAEAAQALPKRKRKECKNSMLTPIFPAYSIKASTELSLHRHSLFIHHGRKPQRQSREEWFSCSR